MEACLFLNIYLSCNSVLPLALEWRYQQFPRFQLSLFAQSCYKRWSLWIPMKLLGTAVKLSCCRNLQTLILDILDNWNAFCLPCHSWVLQLYFWLYDCFGFWRYLGMPVHIHSPYPKSKMNWYWKSLDLEAACMIKWTVAFASYQCPLEWIARIGGSFFKEHLQHFIANNRWERLYLGAQKIRSTCLTTSQNTKDLNLIDQNV